jgi:hypothetical protein
MNRPCSPASAKVLSALLIGMFGGDPGRDLAAVSKSKFGEDVLDVVLCGAVRDHQACSDVSVTASSGDETGDLGLARR